MSLTIKSEQECRWDIASLGEVMLRLDPEKAASIPPVPSACARAAGNTTWPAG